MQGLSNKQKMPLVSVVVSVYNGERYLAECIESIILQDYTNLELIAINDGSTDNSLNILHLFENKDNRIRIVDKQNQGVSISRNLGLKMAKGKYVTIVDQDDVLAPDFISYHLGLIQKYNTEISLIPQVVKFTSEKKLYQESRSENDDEVWSGEKAACEMLYDNVEIGPWNKLVSTDLIRRNNIHFLEWAFGGEGFAFSVECFECSEKVAIGYKGSYYYRVDNATSGMSIYRDTVAESSIRAVQYMIKNRHIDSRRIKNALYFARWNVYFVMLQIMMRSKKTEDYHNQYVRFIKQCHRFPLSGIFAPISLKRKIKGLLCIISPKICIKTITRKNTMRDYSKNEDYNV